MDMDQNKIKFDEDWYLLTYPDVADAVRTGECSSGLEHYMSHGRVEGRQSRIEFDAAGYVNADAAVTGEIGSDHADAPHYCDRNPDHAPLPSSFDGLADLLGPGPIREIRINL